MAEIRYGTNPEYYLFRKKTDAGDQWYIQSVTAWNQARDTGAVELLDRDHFEAAILSVLQ